MADQGVHPARCGFVEVVSKTKHSKTKHPKLENETPKSGNYCRLKDYNVKSCMTQAKPGGGSGCVRTSKGPPIHRTVFILSPRTV